MFDGAAALDAGEEVHSGEERSSVPVRSRKTVSILWLTNCDSSQLGSWMVP